MEDVVAQSVSLGQDKKIAYSSYFEVLLEEIHFGLSRAEHNRICNAQLLEQVKLFELEGRQFCADISNSKLINELTANKIKSPGSQLFTWEHCSSSTTNGRMGVMRLVPFYQHNKNKDSKTLGAVNYHPTTSTAMQDAKRDF